MSVRQETAEELVHQIFVLQRHLRCVTQQSVVSSGPGAALQGVMRIISDSGELRATELAQQLGIGAAGLSRHISELEELGWVQRRPDPQDGRAFLISLSPAGRDALTAALNRRALLLQQMLSEWTEQQALDAAGSLGRLSETLHASTRAARAGDSTAPENAPPAPAASMPPATSPAQEVHAQ